MQYKRSTKPRSAITKKRTKRKITKADASEPAVSSIASETTVKITVPILPIIIELPNLHKHLFKVFELKEGSIKKSIIKIKKTPAIIPSIEISGMKFKIKPK